MFGRCIYSSHDPKIIAVKDILAELLDDCNQCMSKLFLLVIVLF